MAADPSRLPAWRYHLARSALHNGRILLIPEADEITRVLARYLHRERQCGNDGSLQRLRQRDPVIAAALQLSRSRELALLVEALILAREPTRTISEFSGLPSDVVAWYRAAFFSVGSLLDNKAYILNFGIRPELQAERDQSRAYGRFVVKLFAYFCGSAALRDLFLLEPVEIREQWMDPAKLVGRLMLSSAVTAVVENMESPQSWIRHPAQQRDWIDQLVGQLQELRARPWPTNLLQRDAERMI